MLILFPPKTGVDLYCTFIPVSMHRSHAKLHTRYLVNSCVRVPSVLPPAGCRALTQRHARSAAQIPKFPPAMALPALDQCCRSVIFICNIIIIMIIIIIIIRVKWRRETWSSCKGNPMDGEPLWGSLRGKGRRASGSKWKCDEKWKKNRKKEKDKKCLVLYLVSLWVTDHVQRPTLHGPKTRRIRKLGRKPGSESLQRFFTIKSVGVSVSTQGVFPPEK